MGERDANIDLLFRNGLKDYEVLPPQDVWDNIQPSVRVKRISFLIKAAAGIAVIVALGSIMWLLNRNVTEEISNSLAVFDISYSEPVRIAAADQTAAIETPLTALRPAADVPKKVKYSSEIAILDEERIRRFSISSPEKAKTSKVTNSINIGNFGMGMPDYYSGSKLPDKRWSISALASPTYHSKVGSGNEDYIKMAAAENAATSYTGGLGVSYRINKRFSLQTGLYYSAYGQKVDGVSSFSGYQSVSGAKGSLGREILTTNGAIQASSNDIFLEAAPGSGRLISYYNADLFDPAKTNMNFMSSQLIQDFRYIQMPFLLRYKLVDRSIDFNLLGGISYDFLVGNHAFARTETGKQYIGSTSGMNSLIFSSSLGMGVEYNLSEKVSFNFEPTVRYFLNPFNDAMGTRIHPYSIGVFSGISYKF
ncbi:MAG TPA: outer membrane beta-barrel protein [Bacteroidales bacterium]|nr:outer membrane beta-barrel protein [Bacteroidales bacterium]